MDMVSLQPHQVLEVILTIMDERKIRGRWKRYLNSYKKKLKKEKDKLSSGNEAFIRENAGKIKEIDDKIDLVKVMYNEYI